jgi:hypothetical protein
MSQLYVPVILRNAREYVLARHGHLALEQVHMYETPHALIDTGFQLGAVLFPLCRHLSSPHLLVTQPSILITCPVFGVHYNPLGCNAVYKDERMRLASCTW